MFKLYFYPYKNAEGDIDGFQVKLINDFEHTYIYEIEYSSQHQTPQRFTSQISSFDTKPLNYMKFDNLNEGPVFRASFWLKNHKGTGTRQQYQLKIKPKSFFKHKQIDSFTNELYYILTMSPFLAKAKKSEPDSLAKYTQANRHKDPTVEQNTKLFNIEIQRKADFQTFMDLHIEMLAPDPQSLNSHEKLQYQIFKAKEYLEEAFMLGIDKVYLLHGVGKGRLKDEIAAMLKSHADVSHFKNEYHGQYGFGATEVFLK